MKKNKYLYIPLELYHRELRGALLLGTIAANSGWNVIIGQKASLLPVFDVLPNGVFFPKSVVPGEEKQFSKLIQHGHKIASVDAEGLILDNGELGIVRRYSSKTVNLSSLLFFWGEEQCSQAVKYIQNIADKAVVTGSPLFDYWRLQKFNHQSQEKDKDNYKKTILIASSFGMVNHISGLGETPHLQISSAGKKVYEEHFDYLRRTVEVKKITFKAFKIMVENLIDSVGDKYNVILRPHPSEDIKEWESIARQNNNISLQTGGSISKLLLDCDILIHADSTTAIEGYYYSKDVVSFVPKEITDDLYEVLNPYILQVSHVCRSTEEIIKTVDEIMSGIIKRPQFNLNRIINCSDSRSIALSSEKIVDALDSIKIETDKSIPSRVSLLFSPNRIITKLKFRGVWILAWLDYFFNTFSGKFSPRRTRYKYGKTKHNPLNIETIELMVREITKGLKLDLNFTNISQLNKKLFMLSVEEKD